MQKKSTSFSSLKRIPGCPRLTAILLSFVWLLSPLAAAAVAEEMCGTVRSALETAAKLRGLKIKKPVPCKVHNKEQVKAYLLKTIDEKIPAEKLKMEEVAFQALGFIPEDFDYKQGLIDLYLAQIGGYYDPIKKQYVMAGWIPSVMQTTIAVHELTHALQDQYYDLEPFMDPEKFSSDEMFAHSALVEGDASAVMFDYNRQLIGQPLLEKADNVDSLIAQSILSVSMTNASGSAPEGMLMLLIFPYTSGLRFSHELLKRGGYEEIDRAYKRPPSSTEEILHPEKYFSGEKDYKVFKESDLPTDKKIKFSDTFGEFFFSIWLRYKGLTPGAATNASSGWGGDIIGVYEKSASAYGVHWITEWDTEKDAEEFFAAVRKVFSLNGARNKVSGSVSSRRRFDVTRENKRVTIDIDYKKRGS